MTPIRAVKTKMSVDDILATLSFDAGWPLETEYIINTPWGEVSSDFFCPSYFMPQAHMAEVKGWPMGVPA